MAWLEMLAGGRSPAFLLPALWLVAFTTNVDGQALFRNVLMPNPAISGEPAEMLCSTTSPQEVPSNVRLQRGAARVLVPDDDSRSRITVTPPFPTPTLSRTWSFNPILLSDQDTYRCGFSQTDANVRPFKIRASRDLRLEGCSVYGSLNGNLTLRPGFAHLLKSMPFLRRNDSDLVNPGAMSTLACNLTGPAAFNLRQSIWRGEQLVGGEPIMIPGGTSMGPEGRQIISSFTPISSNVWLATLTFMAASRSEAGRYTIIPRDTTSTGSINLLQVNLTVCDPSTVACNYPVYLQTAEPAITAGLSNFEADRDGASNVICQANGVPPPVIRWFNGSLLLQATSTRTKIINTSPSDNMFAVHSELVIIKANYGDRNRYRCEAVTRRLSDNSLIGTTDQSALFRVRDPLGPVWPLLGIAGQVLILVVIFYWDENRRQAKNRTPFGFDTIDGDSKEEGDDETDGAGEAHCTEHLNNLFRCPQKDEGPQSGKRKRPSYQQLVESEL